MTLDKTSKVKTINNIKQERKTKQRNTIRKRGNRQKENKKVAIIAAHSGTVSNPSERKDWHDVAHPLCIQLTHKIPSISLSDLNNIRTVQPVTVACLSFGQLFVMSVLNYLGALESCFSLEGMAQKV